MLLKLLNHHSYNFISFPVGFVAVVAFAFHQAHINSFPIEALQTNLHQYLKIHQRIDAISCNRLKSCIPSSPHCFPNSRTFHLHGNLNTNNNNDLKDDQLSKSNYNRKTQEPNNDSLEVIDPILILPLTTLSTISLLCIYILYTKVTNPISEFDIDFYMALDGAIGYGADALDADTISTLPKLSPAEQLVGAFFGPLS